MAMLKEAKDVQNRKDDIVASSNKQTTEPDFSAVSGK